MNEQLGVKFDMTVDKAEVDTFLRTHISTLIFSAYGAANHNSIGVVGKAENLYKMLATEDYGLLLTELDLLRYLDANSSMTDAELIAKYGLSENKSSVEGLVLLISELLGDSYKFDPILSEEGITNNIREYFVAMLYETVTGLGDGSIIAGLNFVPTRINETNGRLVPNTANINAVTKLINTEIDKLLTTGKDSVLTKVTDGKYHLTEDGLFSEQDMNKLIDAAVEIIRQNTRTEDNAIAADKAVEYATPDTMKADLKAYIESYYYRAVINKIDPGLTAKLYVQTVSSTTDSSIEMLVALRNAAYGDVDAATKYTTYITNLQNDEELEASLASIAALLTEHYGDVNADLTAAYLKVFATVVLGKDKAPTVGDLKRTEGEEQIKLRSEVNDLMTDEKIASLTLENAAEVIAEIVALHAPYEISEDYDVNATSSEYVYYFVLQNLAAAEVDSFYYDAQMAKMDAAVRAEVAEKKVEILAGLAEGFTKYELYSAIMNSLANPEDSVNDFAAAVADEITHVAEGKNSIEDDVLAYYCYSLLNSFEGYELGDAPSVSIDGTSTQIKNALKILDNDLKDRVPLLIADARASAKRGEMPNYALASFMTEDEINAVANELVSALIKALFAKEDERERLTPEVRAYVEHAYYVAVLDRLNADSQPTFHVSEIYGSSLIDAASALKDLMYYFVVSGSDMTAEDIDRLIDTKGNDLGANDEEEDEASRYLSDDGRIVSVTYGDKNADGGYSAYKTFILNYNNFSVSVEYDGVTYTIPAYGYVIVMH